MSEQSRPSRFVRTLLFVGAIGISAAVAHLAMNLTASAPPTRARQETPSTRFIAATSSPPTERVHHSSPSLPSHEQVAPQEPAPAAAEREGRPAEDRQAAFDRASALVEAA